MNKKAVINCLLLVLALQEASGSDSISNRPWLFQKHGDSFGVRDMGYLIRSEAGLLYVIASPASIKVSSRYERPKLAGLKPDTVMLARWDEKNDFVGAANLSVAPEQKIWGIALDREGHVFGMGTVSDGAWIKVNGVRRSPERRGARDALVVRCDAEGNIDRLWQFGGKGQVYPASIVASPDGSLICTGTFDREMRVSDTGKTIYSQGGYDIFVASLRADGGESWLTRLGGSQFDSISKVAADDAGNLYLTGNFTGDAHCADGVLEVTAQPTKPETFFVAKLDGHGIPIWITQSNGDRRSDGYNVQLDLEGNVIVKGIFDHSVSFITEEQRLSLAGTSNLDMFIAKFSNDGEFRSAIRYGKATNLPGEEGWTVVYDFLWNMYLVRDDPGNAGEAVQVMESPNSKTGTEDGTDRPTTPNRTSLQLQSAIPTRARTVEMFLTGDYSGICVVETSADLLHWHATSTNLAIHGRLTLERSYSRSLPMRFFRIRALE